MPESRRPWFQEQRLELAGGPLPSLIRQTLLSWRPISGNDTAITIAGPITVIGGSSDFVPVDKLASLACEMGMDQRDIVGLIQFPTNVRDPRVMAQHEFHRPRLSSAR